MFAPTLKGKKAKLEENRLLLKRTKVITHYRLGAGSKVVNQSLSADTAKAIGETSFKPLRIVDTTTLKAMDNARRDGFSLAFFRPVFATSALDNLGSYQEGSVPEMGPLD